MIIEKIEGNYTKIPNDLLLHLAKTNLCYTEGKIIYVIIIKTFGFQNAPKKNWRFDWISIPQIIELTGISNKQNVSKYLLRLKKRKVILIFPGRKIGINTNYGEWVLSPKDIPKNTDKNELQKSSKMIDGVINNDDNSNTDRGPQNNKIQKKEKLDMVAFEEKTGVESICKTIRKMF